MLSSFELFKQQCQQSGNVLKVFKIDSIMCDSCCKDIEHHVGKIVGIDTVNADLNTKLVFIRLKTNADLSSESIQSHIQANTILKHVSRELQSDEVNSILSETKQGNTKSINFSV